MCKISLTGVGDNDGDSLNSLCDDVGAKVGSMVGIVRSLVSNLIAASFNRDGNNVGHSDGDKVGNDGLKVGKCRKFCSSCR